MAKQTTVRLPDDLADKAEVIARTRGTSVNQLIIDSLVIESIVSVRTPVLCHAQKNSSNVTKKFLMPSATVS
ncbi:MAG: hypothetical protein WCP83_03000 [Actinomycetota bacterium]